MLGLEKKIMDSLIWGDEYGLWTDGDGAEKEETGKEVEDDEEADNEAIESQEAEGDNDTGVSLFKGLEATLGPGDGCYIPAGWWHSLRGIEEEIPGINASVNWWIRPGQLARQAKAKKEQKEEEREQRKLEGKARWEKRRGTDPLAREMERNWKLFQEAKVPKDTKGVWKGQRGSTFRDKKGF